MCFSGMRYQTRPLKHNDALRRVCLKSRILIQSANMPNGIIIVCLSTLAAVPASPALRTNVGRNFNQFVCFRNQFSIQSGSTEKAAIKESPAPTISATGTFSVSGKKQPRSKYIAAIDSASQNQHLQVVFCQQNPTLIKSMPDIQTYD